MQSIQIYILLNICDCDKKKRSWLENKQIPHIWKNNIYLYRML